MNLRKIIALAALSLASLAVAAASPLVGKWTSEFNSQIGVQKYTFEFKAAGDKLAGKAAHDNPLGKGEVDLKDIKLDGENVAFAETVKYNDQEITITYTGKIAGDELKLTRVVGELATYQITARRVVEPAAKPPAK